MWRSRRRGRVADSPLGTSRRRDDVRKRTGARPRYGLAADEREASRLYKAAAERGDAAGQHNLGLCFLAGRGVAANASRAAKWFRAAGDGPRGNRPLGPSRPARVG